MQKVVKAKKYQLRGKMTKKGSEFHQSGRFDLWTSCQKIIAIHFHPFNPVLLPQNARTALFCGII